MRLFRGFDPRNDEIITKAITYVKKVVLAYYDEKASGKPPEIRAFTDTERAGIHKEMNDTLEFILDKSHVMTDIDNDLWRFIYDRVGSALSVYREYLKDESGNLVSEAREVKIGVYRDAEGKRVAKNIEWGELTPLQVVNVTVFLVNEGTEVVYIDLAWNENSWRPEGASQYFSLGWDFRSRSLEPNMSRKVRLFLWVKPNVQDITTFSFDIIIKGSTEP